MPKLLLATGNQGKAREYRALLQGVPFQIVTLSDQGITTVVEEKGRSFEENARLKAAAFADESGLLTLADDSGLEVDVLGGEPGVRSARYAGEDATDTDRINLLLAKLAGVWGNRRAARFVCVIAIAKPQGEITICSGECRGTIATSFRGTGGFGYDPVFYLPEMGKTMAELTSEEKNAVSHRARAVVKVREKLVRLAARL